MLGYHLEYLICVGFRQSTGLHVRLFLLGKDLQNQRRLKIKEPIVVTDSSSGNSTQVPSNALVPFLLITFGLAWGIIALFIFLPNQMTSLVGELTGQHPLFFLAVYSPAIAAFIVVIYYGGTGGLRRCLSRVLIWRCSPVWYAFLIIGIPLLFFGGAVLKGNLFVNHSRSPRFRHLLLRCYLWPSKARSKSLAGVAWLCLYYSVSSRHSGLD